MTAPVWTPEPIPPQAPARRGSVAVPGASIGYWDTGGDGPAVVLLHAATQSLEGWVYQQPVLVGAGYRVIGYSRRGYRGSPFTGEPDPGNATDDLHALLDHLGIAQAHLVAAAHGGFMALDYTLAHPDRVRSLAIVASLMGITDPDYADVLARLRPPFFDTLPHDFRELSPSYRAGNPEGLAAWQAMEHAALIGKRVNPRFHHKMTWALLEAVRQPTRIIGGESDLYAPPALLRMQAQHIRQADLHIISEAGHSPYWEQPARFNALLLEFLRQH